MSKNININLHNMSITNKEALRDKIHEIHNYLRNNGAGYGMNALKVFNIIYGLKKIEEYNLYEKLGIKNDKCKFSYLLELANENKGEELSELILGELLDYFYKDKKLRKFLYYEIPKDIKSKVLSKLIKEIDNIGMIEKSCNVQLSGKIYEYFIGRDESAISELGAYFTDRHIVNYIYDKINIETNDDGSIPSMIDMFGGSGGFTTGYIHYLNQKYNFSDSEESKDYKINWNTELSKVHHYDMNEDVIKSAGLEFLCLTGTLPEEDSLNYKNSFNDEFENNKFSYIVTNPPYGGDKNKKTDANTKLEKIKSYILNELKNLDISKDTEKIAQRKAQLKSIEAQEKQDKLDADKAKVCLESCSTRINKYARDHKLKGGDKEACSLILMMDLLAENGTAVGVLKEGVFFNKSYKDLRTCLIKNFNVTEIISVPQDQFENTSTKTSIIIFKNEVQKTSEVKFYDLIVEKYEEDVFGTDEEGNIVLLENKGDIKGVYDILVSEASADEILSNFISSFNSKDYSKKEINPGKGYKLVKLEDITDIKMGGTPPTNNHKYWENGTYNWVTVSDLNEKHIIETKKKITYEGTEYLKDKMVPKDSILMSFKLSIGKLGIAGENLYCNEAIIFMNSKIKNIPQNYLFYILQSLDLEKYARGTIGIGNLNKEILKNIKIPIPESQEKIDYWVSKISTIHNEIIKREEMLKQYENFVSNRVKEISEKEECEEFELNDICEIELGTRITKKDNIEGNIPVYGGGDITFYTNNSNREKNTLIISRYAMSKECVRLIFTKFFLNDSGMSIKSKDSLLQNYVNYIFLDKNMQNNIYTNFTAGSIQRNINMNAFRKIKIKIPKNNQLIIDLEQYFNVIEQLQDQIKSCESLYKQYIQELADEAIDK